MSCEGNCVPNSRNSKQKSPEVRCMLVMFEEQQRGQYGCSIEEKEMRLAR